MDLEDIKNVSSGASLVNAALTLAAKIRGPKPQLRVKLKHTGANDTSLTFTALVSEVRNDVPALDVQLFAEFDDIPGALYESETFNLAAGQLDRPVRFGIERPKYGTLVAEFASEPTLYGRELTVAAYSESGAVAVDTWSETVYDPETNRARYEIMQRVWRIGRDEATDADWRAETQADLLAKHNASDR